MTRAALLLLVVACHKDDGPPAAKWHWKTPRTTVIENHGAKLPVPDGWRAHADKVYDTEVIQIDAIDMAVASSEDLDEAMALRWQPTEGDLCALKSGGRLDDLLEVTKVEPLPDRTCRITAPPVVTFVRVRGDHTLRFDCTTRDEALCETAWPSITLP